MPENNLQRIDVMLHSQQSLDVRAVVCSTHFVVVSTPCARGPGRCQRRQPAELHAPGLAEYVYYLQSTSIRAPETVTYLTSHDTFIAADVKDARVREQIRR